MSENRSTDTLTTYQKKIVPSLVSSFLDTLSTDKDKLATMAQSMINVDSAQDDIVFLLARGMGYAMQAYLDYDNKDKSVRIAELDTELSALRMQNVSADIMTDIAACKDASQHASIIASFPVRTASIASSISKLSTEKSDLSLGASIAFRDAWDCAVRFGEIRDIHSAGSVVVKLAPGVYRATFKSHVYRFVFYGAENWQVYEVHGKDLVLKTSYASVLKTGTLANDKLPRCTSATKARKIAKICYTGYRGFVDPDKAIASAYNAAFEAFSAGNPTSVNFALVGKDPENWYARSGKGKQLPTEPATPSK